MLAFDAITKITAKDEIKIIPFEKANRWPRLVNCLGKKPSFATIFTIFGNALKQVLAPANKINVVEACTK